MNAASYSSKDKGVTLSELAYTAILRFRFMKMAATKQEGKEEDFNYKTKYKAYKRRLKLLVYVSSVDV